MSQLLQVVKPLTEKVQQALQPALTELLGNDKAPAVIRQECAYLLQHILNSAEGRSSVSLHSCTAASMAGAIRDAVSMGLTLNPAMKQVYLVPYRVKELNQVVAKTMISYQGELDYLASNGVIRSASVGVVRQGDKFDYDRTETGFTFTHKKPTNGKARGEITGAYCCYRLSGGGIHGDFVTAEEIQKRRRVAKTQAVWNMWEDEMAAKTAVRMTRKGLPMVEAVATLEQIDNEHFEIITQITEEDLKQIREKLSGIEEMTDLGATYQALPLAHKRDDEVKQMFSSRAKEIQKQ